MRTRGQGPTFSSRNVFYSDLTADGDIGVFLIDKGVYRKVKKHGLYQMFPEFLAFPALLSYSIIETANTYS